jgi:hypothetical protein
VRNGGINTGKLRRFCVQFRAFRKIICVENEFPAEFLADFEFETNFRNFRAFFNLKNRNAFRVIFWIFRLSIKNSWFL